MESKVAAAELAAGAGIATVIADGTGEDVLTAALAGRAPRNALRRGARARRRSSSGCAMASVCVAACSSTPARARRSSDGGASLLAVGVTDWEGEFRAGDGVELAGPDGTVFARGIASVDSSELAGRPANVEAVHRDRLVLV